MAEYKSKHTGATIDQQIDRVLDGSVVVENTLSALDETSDKPVSGKGIAKAIEKLEDLQYNIAIDNFDGYEAVPLKGYVSIMRFIPISKSIPISTSIALSTIGKRYYRQDLSYIGPSYTDEAKFLRIVLPVKTDYSLVTQNELQNEWVSIDRIKYRLVNGLPLLETYLKEIASGIGSQSVILKDGDISPVFSNINETDRTCSISFQSYGLLLYLDTAYFRNLSVLPIEAQNTDNVPYDYGCLYAKAPANRADSTTPYHQGFDFVVGSIGAYGNPITKEVGYNYIPILAWAGGKVIYKVYKSTDLEVIEQSLSKKYLEEILDIPDSQPFIIGKYWTGYVGEEPIQDVDSTRACYPNRVFVEQAQIQLQINKGYLSNLTVLIRIVGANNRVLSTINKETSGTYPIDEGGKALYISVILPTGFESQDLSKSSIIIDGQKYPLGVNCELKPIPKNNRDYYSNLVSCFERIVCIGDSITAGYTGSDFVGQNIGSNDARVAARNWTSYFKRSTGVDVINLGYGSTTTTHWRNSTPETESSNLNCALELANIEGTQAYFVMVGWNDVISAGSASDIAADYNNNAISFYGNYDNIIRRLHEMKPKAPIFVFTLARTKASSPYNKAIKYIASLYDYCHCIDYSLDEFFSTDFFNKVSDSTHYSPLGYNAFGHFVKVLVSNYIYENPTLFKGIPYTADTEVKGTIDVQGLKLSSANLSIDNISGYQTLCAEIVPITAANKKVTWDIVGGDNSCIELIINQSTVYCTLKGIKSGYAVVRATSDEGGYSATCLVSVASEVVNVDNITLDKTQLTMSLSGTGEVTATISPSSATNQKIRWSLLSGSDSVATIEATDNVCVITPRGTGTDTVIAKTEDGNKEARCSIIIS